MAHPPTRQSEFDADQYMDQEEENQIQVKLGVHISGLLQGQQCPVPPGISWDEKDYHEDEKHPGADSVYLDEKSASLQNIITLRYIICNYSALPIILRSY